MNTIKIKRLLEKCILLKKSGLNPQERIELDEWIKSDPANEELYKRISDQNYLKLRYEDFKAVAASSRHSSAVKVIKWCAGIAAAAIVVFTLYIVTQQNNRKKVLLSSADSVKEVILLLNGEDSIRLKHLTDGTVISGANAVVSGDTLKYLPDTEIGTDAAGSSSDIHRLYIPVNQRYCIILPDGSKVSLNAGSSISYSASYADKESREVQLSGEGYFEVRKDPLSPFVVRTERGVSVRVTGTSFDVKAYRDDKNISTALIEGGVSLQFLDSKGYSRKYDMKPNEISSLDIDSKELCTFEADASLYASWVGGVYCFEHKPLEEVMRDLGRYYGANVFLEGRSVAGKKLSGKLKIEDNLPDMLANFEKILPGHISLKENRITIK